MPDTQMVQADAATMQKGRCPECNIDVSNRSAQSVLDHATLCLPQGEALQNDKRSDHGRRYRLLAGYAANVGKPAGGDQ